MKGVHPLPVLIGLVVINLASRLLGVGPHLFVGLFRQPTTGLLFWVLSLIAMALASAVGGYASARSVGSKESTAATALAAGILYVLLAAALFMFVGNGYGWAPWMVALYLVPIVPSAMVGGRFAARAGLTSAST